MFCDGAILIEYGSAAGARARGEVVMMPKITMTETPEPHLKQAIVAPLTRFNEAQTGRPEDYRRLVLLLSLAGTEQAVGGLWGETVFSHLHVDVLFVPESLRGIGIGRQLMIEAESEPVRRGCIGAWLDTFSFQARGFYERLGYTVFGTIADCPPGHSRIFLRKVLSGESGRTA
jgi:GNAT superfamily N-acetyltransferase